MRSLFVKLGTMNSSVCSVKTINILASFRVRLLFNGIISITEFSEKWERSLK